MIRKICSKLSVLVVPLVICACGEDGSSDFAGVWFGNATLVEDGCGVVDPQRPFITFQHLVNQDGDTVVLDNGALSFSGSKESSDSFKVTAERARSPLQAGQSCTETITWRYEAIDQDQAEFVVRSSSVVCSKDGVTSSCEFSFTGSAFQEGFSGPIPIEPGAGGGDDFAAEDTL